MREMVPYHKQLWNKIKRDLSQKIIRWETIGLWKILLGIEISFCIYFHLNFYECKCSISCLLLGGIMNRMQILIRTI